MPQVPISNALKLTELALDFLGWNSYKVPPVLTYNFLPIRRMSCTHPDKPLLLE